MMLNNPSTPVSEPVIQSQETLTRNNACEEPARNTAVVASNGAENTMVAHHTGIASTRTTNSGPTVITSAKKADDTNCVPSPQGPEIPSHSDIILQRQYDLECDTYNLLDCTMVSKEINLVETNLQYQSIYEFYKKLKGFTAQIEHWDKNIH